jgi:hypothetical protein
MCLDLFGTDLTEMKAYVKPQNDGECFQNECKTQRKREEKVKACLLHSGYCTRNMFPIICSFFFWNCAGIIMAVCAI